MEPLVTSEQMREYDRFAIRNLRISGIVLMENAGRGVAMAAERSLGSPRGKMVVVVCGKGNNGGDGFVTARHLACSGAQVIVFLTSSPADLKGDAATEFTILKNFIKHSTDESIQIVTSLKALKRRKEPDIIIDAVFGTGFAGKVRAPYDKIIDWMNSCVAPIIAIDVPSGLNSDNGGVQNVAVRATETVTMGRKKIGLFVGKGPQHAGVITLERIGVPENLSSPLRTQTYLINSIDVRERLPRRPLDAHKHSVGKIFILAGSPGLTGAAAMVAQSAMRTGAGAVVLGVPTSVYTILAKKLTEVMTEPLAETEAGTLGMNSYLTIRKFTDWSDAVIIGPGLGRHTETQSLVVKLIHELRKPLVLDADGLNALVGNWLPLTRSKNKQIVITPHTGELSRLIRVEAREIEDNRVDVARQWAKKLGAVLVLKGAPTVTATPGGDVVINSSGNPGMATAGSGDVLAGIIGTLLSQKMEPPAAAWCGVYIHGLAGDLAKKQFGERSLMAMDILHKIPAALFNIENNVE